ncbi:cell wall-active antibiotics response protein [Dehalococcoidia bacterium]|nr:cell wall-active antibiotics response protein [Dehalococcoidia bacterium]
MSETKSPRKHRISIWGIILVFVGVVLLLQNFDLLPWGLWAMLWRFWPVILIIIGIDIIIGRHKPWLSTFLVLVVLGAFLGVAVWQYQMPPCQEVIITHSEPRGDLHEAVVEVDFQAGHLRLSALPPDSPNLVEALSRGASLTADFRREDTVGNLRLNSTWDRRPPWRRVGTGWTEWEVELTQDISLTLEVQSDAVNAELDLYHLKVTRLDLELNAANCEIMMPSGAAVTRAFIEANAANIEITIPDGVAARIEADVTVGAIEIDETRFPRRGDYYISPGFEDAQNRIYLRIELNAGFVEVS